MRLARPFFLAVLLAEGCAHHPVDHRFDDPQTWAKRWDDPSRDADQKPDEVLAALALAPGASVADVGAGTGYFSVRLARTVPQGKVFAVDLEPAMVAHLRERAVKENLANLVAVQAAADDPKLPEPVYLVLIVNTYHHLEDRVAYFQRLKSSLTADGKVAVVDFRRGAPHGPPDAHKVPPEEVIAELSAAGFLLEADHEFLPHQYFLVFSQ
ncbi:MAG: class I SAM-dependent methyltransferase [Myxococcota bacterium]